MFKEELDNLNQQDKEYVVMDTGAKYTIFINLVDTLVEPNFVVESMFQVIFIRLNAELFV
jgi:hypothetical protein